MQEWSAGMDYLGSEDGGVLIRSDAAFLGMGFAWLFSFMSFGCGEHGVSWGIAICCVAGVSLAWFVVVSSMS